MAPTRSFGRTWAVLFSLLGDARGFQSCRNRGKGGLPFAGLQGRLKWVRREMVGHKPSPFEPVEHLGAQKSAGSSQLAAQDA